MPIVYIIETINTSKRNVRQAQQIEDSLSSFKDKVRYQDLKGILSNLSVKLNYSSINKFWDVFGDKALMERLSTYKNIDKYKNIVRFFHAQLALFVWNLHYNKYKIVFYFITPAFYHFKIKTRKLFYHSYLKTYIIGLRHNWFSTLIAISRNDIKQMLTSIFRVNKYVLSI